MCGRLVLHVLRPLVQGHQSKKDKGAKKSSQEAGAQKDQGRKDEEEGDEGAAAEVCNCRHVCTFCCSC